MKINEDQWDILDELNQQVCILKDPETYRCINKTHADFLGKKKEEVENKKIVDLFNKNEAHRLIRDNKEVFKHKMNTSIETWVSNKDIKYRCLQIQRKPVCDEAQNVKYVICTAEDITEQKIQKQKYTMNDAEYKKIVEKQTNLICKSLPDTTITFVNQAYCDYFEGTFDELVGTSFMVYIPDAYHEQFSNMFKEVSVEKPIYTHEHQVTLPNGKIVYHRWSNHAYFNEAGEIVEFLSVGTDITKLKTNENFLLEEIKNKNLEIELDIIQRKQLEAYLEDLEEQHRKLVNLSPYGIAVSNSAKIMFCNSAFAKILGYENRKELFNKTIFDLFHPDYVNEARKKYKRILAGESMVVSEYKLIDANHQLVDVEVNSISLKKDSQLILSIVRETSERKKAEELQRKIEEEEKLRKSEQEYNTLRTEFFANISHELRTPLNLIFSTLQLIEYDEAVKGKSHNRYNKIIKQNCFRLLRLINNFLDITKIDSGYLDLKLMNCDIVKIIRDITHSVADYIKNKNIRLYFNTNIKECIMACDPDKIERIMLNLLSNSVKFTKANGHIEVNIHKDGKNIVISVKDTGIGIPEQHKELIFSRFMQSDKSFTRKHEGSGIGLSLIRSLVDMHGGKIAVYSEYGKGSEFTVKLPITTVKDTCYQEYLYNEMDSYVENIRIEFSDIYSI